ncbi:hypothetical protein M1N05_00575 [Dehalococcoidales bacterium]|nr:hypothetical protein [Dehalococcoidales bacterium]MCL0091372.1 hypothetical protein [Dehalococcoidales bacterium]MCL0091378.1 hypothetical protein [Dehalococcoidales bacterium]
MGWQHEVVYGTSFDFTDWFYYYAINETQNVEQAKANALVKVPDAEGV